MDKPNPARKSSFDMAGLLACARGELFGPGNARLPLPPMLMFDRITKINETGGSAGKGEIEAELDVNPNLWFFKCHFQDDPVMPGCLGLDALWQMVGFFLGWAGGLGKGRALGVGEVKLTAMILPTAKKITYYVEPGRDQRRLVMGAADGIVKSTAPRFAEDIIVCSAMPWLPARRTAAGLHCVIRRHFKEGNP